MKGKIKRILSSVRVWIYILAIIFALIAINPAFNVSGVAIRSVAKNSPAELAGMKAPAPTIAPRNREIITEINDIKIHNTEEYYKVLSNIKPGMTVKIKTNKKTYFLIAKKNNKTNEIYLGLSVYDAPKSNIKLGLDLIGGTRVILSPKEKINDSSIIDLAIESLRERLNVYGLSDVQVRKSRDLDGNYYIIVEIAGATEEEVRELLSKQGKFEAKIGNKTVFIGGRKDITSVCRTPQCSTPSDPQRGGCRKSGDRYVCIFGFQITLSAKAAERQANITKNLEVIYDNSREGRLNETLDLYLDGVLVDSLQISASLKGKPATMIWISGPGYGSTMKEALQNSIKNMKKLQTILLTGSLPIQLEIVKMDAISPTLSKEFLSSIFIIGLISMALISLILVLRYKEPRVFIPVILVLGGEILLLLGFAALVQWQLDLVAIAGIIIAVGTGVDDQIVIIDEIKRGVKAKYIDWKGRIKKAFFIIFGSYFTTIAAMVPLFWAGAGLLKGFAFTTVVGVSIGVFITRPTFATIMEILIEKKK